MERKLDSKINHYIESLRLNPKKEAAVRKLVESVSQSNGNPDLDNGGANDTGKDIFICIINETMIDNLPESFINELKSISDLVSYDNPTYISTDKAHNILDLNVIILNDRAEILKVDKAYTIKGNNPLTYIYNGVYINMEMLGASEDNGYNVYGISANDDCLLQITHVVNENAFGHLGEEFNKLGFYIQNYTPT